MQAQTITLDVSRNGTIRTLGDQFTSPVTFVKELLQNARRAGASRIRVAYDDGVLTIEDDGHGINDPQKLLMIGESSWNDLDLMARENPFGIGFASSLFAAESIEVDTCGWGFKSSTENLLTFLPVAIEESSRRRGTRIGLRLTEALAGKAPFDSLNNASVFFETLAQGFPIPIEFNGRRLAAPLAEQPDARQIEYGTLQGNVLPLSVDEIEARRMAETVLVFLQGFLIDVIVPCNRYSKNGYRKERPAYAPGLASDAICPVSQPERYSVIHLDSQRVRARVPDRNQLIEEEGVYGAISHSFMAIQAELLPVAKSRMAPEDFVSHFANLCMERGQARLLNDLPLPTKWLWDVSGFYAYEDRCDWTPVRQPLGPCDDILLSNVEFEDTRIIGAISLYAEHAGLKVFTGPDLDEAHWAAGSIINIAKVSEENMQQGQYFGFHTKAMPLNTVGDSALLADGMNTRFVFCDAIRLTPTDDRLTPRDIDKGACFSLENDAFLVTRNACYEDISHALLALYEYGETDTQDRDETQLYQDVTRIMAVQQLYSARPLDELMTEHANRHLSHLAEALQGKSVTFEVEANGKIICTTTN